MNTVITTWVISLCVIICSHFMHFVCCDINNFLLTHSINRAILLTLFIIGFVFAVDMFSILMSIVN